MMSAGTQQPKSLWVIAFFGAGILVGVCNAACFYSPAEKHEGGDPGGCVYEGGFHKYGSRWRTKDCLDCDCLADGSVSCCQAYGKPVKYDKEKCVAVWDKEACVYHLMRKDNPKETCDHAMIG